MSELEQRVAYLHGLASGFNLRDASKEGQVLMEVLDVLDLMVSGITRVETAHEDLEEYVESLDEDLTELEEDYYELDEDGEDGAEVECPSCGMTFDVEEDEEEDAQALDLTCPGCGVLVGEATDEAAGEGAGEGEGRPRGLGDGGVRERR